MPKPSQNNSKKIDYIIEQLSNLVYEQKKFSGQLNSFAKRQDQFEKLQVRFEERQVQFEERQDRFEDRQDRFEERQVQFEERQDRFEERQDRFEGRQDRFEGRQDRFEGRQDRFEENQQLFVKKLESLEFGIDEKVEQLRAIIIEIGEANSQETKNLRQEVMEKIDRLLIAMDAQSRDFGNFQTEKIALGASVDRLQIEVDKLKGSDNNQNDKLIELETRVTHLEENK